MRAKDRAVVAKVAGTRCRTVSKDESASHRYRFPAGFTLEAGSEVRVFTGCGTDTAAELHWCNNSAVWNNEGDTAFIRDVSGNIVDSRSY